jgi:hypothetical protein
MSRQLANAPRFAVALGPLGGMWAGLDPPPVTIR